MWQTKVLTILLIKLCNPHLSVLYFFLPSFFFLSLFSLNTFAACDVAAWLTSSGGGVIIAGMRHIVLGYCCLTGRSAHTVINTTWRKSLLLDEATIWWPKRRREKKREKSAGYYTDQGRKHHGY